MAATEKQKKSKERSPDDQQADAIARTVNELQDAIYKNFKDTKIEVTAVFVRAVERLLQVKWDKLKVKETNSLLQSNDTDLFLKLAERIGRDAEYMRSPRERLRLEGIKRFRVMIERVGGTESIKDVKVRLAVKADDTIHKRVKNKTMIAIPVGERYEYPVWQFDGAKMVANFGGVLQMLNAEHYVDQTRFFITPSRYLDNLNPIDALKKGEQYLERVKMNAKQFQQQGAK